MPAITRLPMLRCNLNQTTPLRVNRENCSLLGTDRSAELIPERIFAPNGSYCLYITQLRSANP